MRVEGITIKPYYQQLIHGAAKDACWKKKKAESKQKNARAKNAAGKNQDHWIATLNIGVQMG